MDQKHMIAALSRLTIQVLIYFAPIHPWFKIIGILLTEAVDSLLLSMMNVNNLADSPMYAIHDKLNDLVGFVLVLLVIQKESILPPYAIAILVAAVAYRTVQVPAYFVIHNWSFVAFPDFFKELLAALLLINWIRPKAKAMNIAITCVVVCIFKTMYEYFYHDERLFGK